jgi:hypothetical protein
MRIKFGQECGEEIFFKKMKKINSKYSTLTIVSHHTTSCFVYENKLN